MREQVVDRDRSFDRGDGIADRDTGVGGRAGGSREVVLPIRRRDQGRGRKRTSVIDIGGRHRGVGEDAVDAVGVIVGRQVLESMRPEIQRVHSDRRGQVGVGGGPTSLREGDPVVQRRLDQCVGTGHDGRRHRCSHLAEGHVIEGVARGARRCSGGRVRQRERAAERRDVDRRSGEVGRRAAVCRARDPVVVLERVCRGIGGNVGRDTRRGSACRAARTSRTSRTARAARAARTGARSRSSADGQRVAEDQHRSELLGNDTDGRIGRNC